MPRKIAVNFPFQISALRPFDILSNIFLSYYTLLAIHRVLCKTNRTLTAQYSYSIFFKNTG